MERLTITSDETLMAYSDVDPTAPELAKTHGVPHFNDFDEFTAAQKVGRSVAEAIILATPTHTHVPLARKLLEHNIAILIEKPVAVTGQDGRELIAACQSHESSVVMVGHHRRHNCYVRAIKKVVEGGKLGKIMAVNGGL
jgi:predicted dehydrogenase